MKAARRFSLVPLFLFPVLFLGTDYGCAGAGGGADAGAGADASPGGPWQVITVPLTAEVAANFVSPPREYGAMQQFQSWNGADQADVRKRIAFDLDQMEANGIFMINLSPGGAIWRTANRRTFRRDTWTW